ncbi:hypothetical protein CXR25_13865 [Brevibacterium aurantiacum]|uniref:phage tail tube protein n=1 Tax=Brevibacterium aurantiacum TaxID=273384 RepID=UPI000F64D52F|nr:hypothetical protein [Brevibacterium aurantiacum]AZL13782.1 hypothetical protein CXR25_13865 [Brevibacterium aurantiacum]
MPKSLADGHTRVALLSAKPEDPMAPTITELEAGIDASCRINSADYNVTPAASETVEEKELCVEGNAVAFGPSNGTVEFTPFRYFDETGAPETGGVEGEIGDAVFQATKEKGTRLWLYQRETSKKATDAWEAGDEVDGFEFITDNPQQVDRTGYVKRKVVGAYQDMWLNAAVATAGP